MCFLVICPQKELLRKSILFDSTAVTIYLFHFVHFRPPNALRRVVMERNKTFTLIFLLFGLSVHPTRTVRDRAERKLFSDTSNKNELNKKTIRIRVVCSAAVWARRYEYHSESVPIHHRLRISTCKRGAMSQRMSRK